MSWYGDDLKALSAAMTRDLKKAYQEAKKAASDAAEALSAARAKYAAAIFALGEAVDAAAVAAAANAVALAAAGVTAAEAAAAAAAAVAEAAAAALAAVAALVGGCYAGQYIGRGLDWLFGSVTPRKLPGPRWREPAFPPANGELAACVANAMISMLDASHLDKPMALAELGVRFPRANIYESDEVASAMHRVLVANVSTFFHVAQLAASVRAEDARAASLAEGLRLDFANQAQAYERAIHVLEKTAPPFSQTRLSGADYNAFIQDVRTRGPNALPAGEASIMLLVMTAASLESKEDLGKSLSAWVAGPDSDGAELLFQKERETDVTAIDLMRANLAHWRRLEQLNWAKVIRAPGRASSGSNQRARAGA